MRTHYCGAVTAADIGNTVTLCGWAHRRRDHGGVIFIDLRDREGMMQVVIDPDTPEAFKTLSNLAEFSCARGNPEKGEEYARRAVSIAERLSGAGSPDVALALHSLASARRQQGRHEDALRLYARARAILENTYGADSPRLGQQPTSRSTLSTRLAVPPIGT